MRVKIPADVIGFDTLGGAMAYQASALPDCYRL
jgi:hypothetical protein